MQNFSLQELENKSAKSSKKFLTSTIQSNAVRDSLQGPSNVEAYFDSTKH